MAEDESGARGGGEGRRRRDGLLRRSRSEKSGSSAGQRVVEVNRILRTGMRDPGPNTLAMVKRSPDGWTLNFLLCNPNERDLDVIEAAERGRKAARAEKAPTLAEARSPWNSGPSVAATLVCDLDCGSKGGSRLAVSP